jgi:hypothetical protein
MERKDEVPTMLAAALLWHTCYGFVDKNSAHPQRLLPDLRVLQGGSPLLWESLQFTMRKSRWESSRWAVHHEDHRQNSFSPPQRDSDPSASPTFIDKHMPDVRRVHTLGTNTKQFSPHPLASASWAPPASWMREAKGSPLWSTTLARRTLTPPGLHYPKHVHTMWHTFARQRSNAPLGLLDPDSPRRADSLPVATCIPWTREGYLMATTKTLWTKIWGGIERWKG